MAIEGTLQEINLPTLLQMVSQQGAGQSCILLQRDKERAVLYLNGHIVSHAEFATQTAAGLQTITGEEVFYELLTWQTGKFAVKRDIAPPQQSIGKTWESLLMEGLRRLDEGVHHDADEHPMDTPPVDDNVLDMLDSLSAEDAEAIRELIALQKETEIMSKSEQLRSILQDLVNNSTDIVGAAVVDNDGLLLASVFSTAIDGNRVAAVSAGLISLSSRSAQQLGQGSVKQTLIQADNGNIIAVRASEHASFVALTTVNVNLGMAFMECRDAAKSISQTL